MIIAKKKIYKSLVVFTGAILIFSSVSAFISNKNASAGNNLCGMDIALVIDRSSSIAPDQLNEVKNAYKQFVDDFIPSTPSRFSLTVFGTEAGVAQNFTADKNVIKNSIDAVMPGQGVLDPERDMDTNEHTNWEDGLVKAGSTFDLNSARPKIILFASDGMPNHYGNPAIRADRGGALAAAVSKADELKNNGIRIVVLGIIGVGDGLPPEDALDVDSLKAIAGPALSGSSYDAIVAPPAPVNENADVILSDFSTMAEKLSAFAETFCNNKIIVQKGIDTDNDGTMDIDWQTPSSDLADWIFNVSEGSSPVEQTTGNTGLLEFDVENGVYSVTEKDVKPGMVLTSANCTKNNANVGVFDSEERAVSRIGINDGDTVRCYFVNASIPSPSPTPTSSPTPTPTPSPSVTPTPSPSVTPTPSPTSSATPTPSPSPSASPTPTPSVSPTPVPTIPPGGGGPLAPNPAIDLVKVPSPSTLPQGGGSVTYKYILSNPGNIVLTDITLTDDKCSPVNYVNGDYNYDKSLDVTEIWNYTCQSALTVTTTDTAIATGKAAGQTVKDIATATVVVGGAGGGGGGPVSGPAIAITKRGVPNPLPYGGALENYSFNITNPGNVPLANITLSDSVCSPVMFSEGDTNTNNQLDINESWAYKCKIDLKSATTNIASVTGRYGNQIVTAYATLTIPMEEKQPVIPKKMPKTGHRPAADNPEKNIAILVIISGVVGLITRNRFV